MTWREQKPESQAVERREMTGWNLRNKIDEIREGKEK